MLVSAIVIVGLSIVTFSLPVFGDPAAVVNLGGKARLFPNDYIDRVSAEWTDRKNKNTLVTAKFVVKKTLPSTAQIKVNGSYNGEPLSEYVTEVCEGLVEPTVGKSIPDVGLPKGEFPRECPFTTGDFTVLKWDPPTRLLPTVPEGKIVGSFMLVDGDAIFFSVDFEGTLKNRIPGLGR